MSEQDKLDQMKTEPQQKPQRLEEMVEQARESAELLQNPAFSRAYQRLFHRLVTELTRAEPDQLQRHQLKLQVLDELAKQLNTEYHAAEVAAAQTQQQ